MSNLEIYEKVRDVPAEAQKTIKAGRLSGMTDINPMWRIKKLTEVFGIVGFGWKAEIVSTDVYEVANGEKSVQIKINLYVKHNGEWSEAIPGIGGSLLIANETKGLHSDDEAFKKAYTDAISVACKALGIGANVYWNKDTESKYGTTQTETAPKQTTAKKYAPANDGDIPFCEICKKAITKVERKDGSIMTVPEIVDYSKRHNEGHIYCSECMRKNNGT